jgi:hypothetical protein
MVIDRTKWLIDNKDMKTMSDMPTNVSYSGNDQTKSGKIVSIWEVRCLYCSRTRKIKRADHAKSHAEKLCKFCSSKNNRPQNDHRGMRISFINRYRLSAKSRNKEWSLSNDDLADLVDSQKSLCALTGVNLKFKGDFDQITASLDRIDNSKGYITGNVQWVHKEVNMMRGGLSIERFKEICSLVADREKVVN